MFPFKVEISLLLLLTTASVDPNPVPGLLEDVDFLEEAGNLSRDLNSIYTGWVNSSFIYPYYLKGSTIVNDLYGSVNRTGLVVAGAALLGVSGYAFLSELNAIPNVDGVAQSVKDLQGFMDGVISRFQGSLKSVQGSLASFKPTSLDAFDRADVVYSLPGPPYNYDVDSVMNLSTTLKTSIRKDENDQKRTTTSPTFLSIDNYFDYLDSNTDILNEINDEPIKPVHPVNNQIERPGQFDVKNDFTLTPYNEDWNDFEPSYYVSQELDDKPFLEYEDEPSQIFNYGNHQYPKKPNSIKWNFVEQKPIHVEKTRKSKYDNFKNEKYKIQKTYPIPTRKKYQSFTKPGKYRKPNFPKYESHRKYFDKKENYNFKTPTFKFTNYKKKKPYRYENHVRAVKTPPTLAPRRKNTRKPFRRKYPRQNPRYRRDFQNIL